MGDPFEGVADEAPVDREPLRGLRHRVDVVRRNPASLEEGAEIAELPFGVLSQARVAEGSLERFIGHGESVW